MKKDLTQEEVRELFDYRDGSLYWKVRKYQPSQVGQEAGYINDKGYRVISAKGHRWKAHQLVMIYHNGCYPKPPYQTDHINGIRDDNRIENLRFVTQSQNERCKGISKRNTSGFVGVSYKIPDCKWVASITINKKVINLGSYKTKERAIQARLEGESKFYGVYVPLERRVGG